ncbi:class I SAM-dependent methyltransferase [Cyclobacterium sp.]|uniref:THUMP-like domain-containing protein n=1 Tax=Cyclobacterium sp. TaxID=1966343 RepID=UPI001985EA5B|nr:class I SAM-dependent methyltransferase [Cyclobacterium sp.]MBD3626501.1 class I SAM-dependent methyltransferase [Cyclobacterium sp.]
MALQATYDSQLKQFVQDHLDEDPAQLLLRHKEIPGLDIKAAARQIAMRQKARQKLPSWSANPSLIFPPALSMEQCSSEATARYKSSLFQGNTLADLTGGFGVDIVYLGENFTQLTYIEQQDELVELARHNLPQLLNSRQLRIIHQDGIAFLHQTREKFDLLFVDPARRGKDNRKLYRLQDLEPDVVENWTLLQKKAAKILIKASPMLDISMAGRELPGLSEIHVVSVKNEVRELLLLYNGSHQPLKIIAVEINGQDQSVFSFTPEEELNAAPVFSFPQKYLVIPYAGILKAGAFKSFAVKQGLAKLHPHTHVYTTDQFPEAVPGRVFEVLEEIKADKKLIKKLYPEGLAHIISRNHPLKADAFKKKFRLRDGGDEFLLAVTVMNGKTGVWRCRMV